MFEDGLAILFVAVGKKRSISKPSDVTDDPGHPPISADNFAKHVNKLHKSDDRGFMIEYNVRRPILGVFCRCLRSVVGCLGRLLEA